MEGSFAPRLRALVEEGKGEVLGQTRFFTLVTLDSGARIGLDEAAQFILVREDGASIVPFSLAEAYVFHEVVESRRNAFDDALEDGARALGLPALDVALAFPAIDIVRAVLAKNVHYTTRLALSWLRPSELRDMRDDIKRIIEDRYTPPPIRDLAERLLVPM